MENIVFTTILDEENLALLITYSDDKCPAIVARKQSGLHCAKTWEKIMTLVWRRRIRATHKNIVFYKGI